MKPTLRNTLMMLTILSSGFFFLSSEMAAAGVNKSDLEKITTGGFKKKGHKASTIFEKPDLKEVVENITFKQYPILGEAKADVNMALNLHQTAASLLAEKEQLEKYKENIDIHEKIKANLEQNKQCNINLLKENFKEKDANRIWERASAYAEDTAAELLEQASHSLGKGKNNKDVNDYSLGELEETEKDIKDKEAKGVLTEADVPGGMKTQSNSSDSKYKDINQDTTSEKLAELVNAASSEANSSSTDMDMNDAVLFGKVRWDVGTAILKDIYLHTNEWLKSDNGSEGEMAKPFSPWEDQKKIYDVYVKKHYQTMENCFRNKRWEEPRYCWRQVCNWVDDEDGGHDECYDEEYQCGVDIKIDPEPFPEKPTVKNPGNGQDPYLPQYNYRNYDKEYAEGKLEPLNESLSDDKRLNSPDEQWCGNKDGKKKVCHRINQGKLLETHEEYVRKLTSGEHFERKEDSELGGDWEREICKNPDLLKPPYIPQRPLPPWREIVYILNTEKQIPEMGSALPDPWQRVTKAVENYKENGELSHLVEVSGNTVRYRPGDYNPETGQVKRGADGNPKMPIPLVTNRISSYLTLFSAEEDQRPVRERAEAAIEEMENNIRKVLETAGYTGLPKDFDLTKESDYNKALAKLGEFQNIKINSAKAKINQLKGKFPVLLGEVQEMINDEMETMNALQKDSEFLIGVSRDDRKEIEDLLNKARADKEANALYKENLKDQQKDLSKVPEVDCPIR